MKKNEKNWKMKYEANIKYDAENTIRVGFKLNKKTDADILEAFNNAPSKQGFVKDAIRFYLAHKDEIQED